LEPIKSAQTLEFSPPVDAICDDVPLGATVAPRTNFQASDAHPGRVMELGFIPNFEPRDFAIAFEGFPLWLLSLERTFCWRLHILGWPSAGDVWRYLEQKGSHQVQLAHRAFAHLGLGRIVFHADSVPPPGSLLLASGSVPFLAEAATLFGDHPALYISSSHWKGRKSPLGPAKKRLLHQAFGGPTQGVTLRPHWRPLFDGMWATFLSTDYGPCQPSWQL
jgi:hypothetical protein